MINSPELREECAQRLLAAVARAENLTAFVGFDGFVDEIIHVVDKRENAESFSRLPTIAAFSARLAAAAGRSTNVELVNVRTKLGGNGPIMANALAGFGIKVTYLGTLGYPAIHPIFSEFGKRAEIHSIAEPGHTDALEFDDGKIMLGKHYPLKEVTWANVQARFGRDRFAAKFGSANLVGFVNWTMLPYMSELWEALQSELCPDLSDPRRLMFIDIADPEKRTGNDIAHALELITRFEKYFDVVIGLNEKEAYELGAVLGSAPKPKTPEGLAALAADIQHHLPVQTIVIHPVSYALAAGEATPAIIEGPFTAKPVITTGAGDHFNSGFCLGKLLGFNNAMSVQTGVTTSGFYVRTGQSPSIQDLAWLLRNWPSKS